MNAPGARRSRLLLAVLSGLMLGLAYPPVPNGVLALFAFVPFFLLFEGIDTYGRGLRYAYFMFFILNLCTLYWAGGYTHMKDPYLMIGGALLILVHPFFFCVPVLLWIFFRRQFTFGTSVCAFPLIFVGFEYVHSLTELGFPWLTLGNTQTYDLALIQFASVTGVYGISFWILVFNVLVYFLIRSLSSGRWKLFSLRSFASVAALLVLAFAPKFYGGSVLSSGERAAAGPRLKVALIQPNIDPFEKWEASADNQLALIQHQTQALGVRGADLVIWPETAVPFFVLQPLNRFYLNAIRQEVDTLGIALLTGLPDVLYYDPGGKAPGSAKRTPEGRSYDTFNSCALIQPKHFEIQKYAKVLLVPFAERVPFSEELSFLNAMQWNFGLGGWAHGKDTVVFRLSVSPREEAVRFSPMICYESAYPGFVASFVRKGAEFLAVITNDSWWGNTSGAYQHRQITALRAVENRRWIVQCANGGISCIVDPYGRIVQETVMYSQATLAGTVEARKDETFYARNGDWFAELCLTIGLFLLAAAGGNALYRRRRRMTEPPEGEDSLAPSQNNPEEHG